MMNTFLKTAIILIAIGFGSFKGEGQARKLAVHQLVYNSHIDLTKDKWTPQSTHLTPQVSNKILSAEVRLHQNELILDYQLGHPGQDGYYLVSLEIMMGNQIIVPTPSYLIGDLGLIHPDKKGERQIIWTDLFSQLLRESGQIQLKLKAEWWGKQFLAYGVNCNEYPEFKFKHKIPYYAGAGIGIGSIISSVILKNQAEKHFDRHRLATTLDKRNSEYESYSDQLKAAEIMSYVGVGILVLDGLMYFLAKERHNKRIRVFEENCKDTGLQIQPFWKIPTKGTSSQMGLCFSYQF